MPITRGEAHVRYMNYRAKQVLHKLIDERDIPGLVIDYLCTVVEGMPKYDDSTSLQREGDEQ